MRKWYNDHIDDRYIYALFNSDQKHLNVYIGQTTNVRRRYKQHLKSSNQWFKEPPEVLVLEKTRTSQYEAYQLEAVWLRVALRQNLKIHNSEGDFQSAWSLWDKLKPLAQNRRFPKPSEINNFQMIEDPDLLNHLHASWIRLIGET